MNKNVVIWMEMPDGSTETTVGYLVYTFGPTPICRSVVTYWDHIFNRYDARVDVVRVTQGKLPGD